MNIHKILVFIISALSQGLFGLIIEHSLVAYPGYGLTAYIAGVCTLILYYVISNNYELEVNRKL